MSFGERIFDELAHPIVARLSKRLKLSIDSVRASYQETFSNYVRQSIDRCSDVRTVVSQDRSVKLRDIYVSPTMMVDGITLTEAQLMQLLRDGRKFVLSATAGQGKTCLTKMLVIDTIIMQQGRVPILINLRDITRFLSDEEEKVDRLVFFKSLYALVASSHQIRTDAVDLFIAGLETGVFTLFLDGCDEVAPSSRSSLLRQIKQLPTLFPDCGCVLTTRPHTGIEYLDGFQALSLYPMTKGQVVTLINKCPHNDDQLKLRFIELVNTSLFDTHQSFMQVPFLTMVMMLTYKRYGRLSERVTVFYKQAFDALFLEIDAWKGGYQRDRHQSLPIDMFISLLSAFCFRTLAMHRFSFTRSELYDEILKAASVMEVPIAVDKIVMDLTESVCILQIDNLEFTFVHRLFQEYFAAVFLSSFDGENSFRVFDRAIRISQDTNVGSMLREINRRSLEKNWSTPTLDELWRVLSPVSPTQDVCSILRVMAGSIEARGDDGGTGRIAVGNGSSPAWDKIYALWRVYGGEFLGNLDDLLRYVRLYSSQDRGCGDTARRLDPPPDALRLLATMAERRSAQPRDGGDRRLPALTIEIEPGLNEWLLQTDFVSIAVALKDAVGRLRNDVLTRSIKYREHSSLLF